MKKQTKITTKPEKKKKIQRFKSICIFHYSLDPISSTNSITLKRPIITLILNWGRIFDTSAINIHKNRLYTVMRVTVFCWVQGVFARLSKDTVGQRAQLSP